MKALLLADGRVMTEQRSEEIGAELPRSALDLHGIDFPTEVTGEARRFDRGMMERAWRADAGRPGTAFADFPNVANYAPTLYAPSPLDCGLEKRWTCRAWAVSMWDGWSMPRPG